MKKLISCLLALVCLLSLAACSKNEDADTSTEVTQEQIEAAYRQDAVLLADAMRLRYAQADDYVIMANDFNMSRDLFVNRLAGYLNAGQSDVQAMNSVMAYAEVQALYHAALNAGVQIDEADVRQRQAENRATVEELAASDDLENGGHYTKIYFDTLVENGVNLEDYWALDLERWIIYDTISAFTQQLHDNNYIGLGGTDDDLAAWQQFCVDFTRGELAAQNLTLSDEVQWELTADNYHSELWPTIG